jgi:hypothetical protein
MDRLGKARSAAVAVPLLMILAAAACTGDDGGALTAATPTGGGPELEFIACMRGQGVEMVDPVPGDTSGRSALRYEIDVNGKGNDPAFQAALDACLEYLPAPPPPEPVTQDELGARRAYAQCMRDNGVQDFPDPEPDGTWNYWFRGDDAVGQSAVEACAHLQPAE